MNWSNADLVSSITIYKIKKSYSVFEQSSLRADWFPMNNQPDRLVVNILNQRLWNEFILLIYLSAQQGLHSV